MYEEGDARRSTPLSGDRACGRAGGLRLERRRSPVPSTLASQPASARVTAASAPAEGDFLSLADDRTGTTKDPSEERNRATLEFNQKINRSVVYPVAESYREGVPEVVRDSIESFSNNLGEPLIFANDLLQLRPQAAATTAARFAMNSTFGLAGLVDVASREKLPRQTGDFGQTLYVWGARDSEYLVLPIMGPTTTRDLIGSTVEFVAMLPVNWSGPAGLAAQAREFGLAGSTATTLTTGVNISGSTAGALSKVDKAGNCKRSRTAPWTSTSCCRASPCRSGTRSSRRHWRRAAGRLSPTRASKPRPSADIQEARERDCRGGGAESGHGPAMKTVS